MAYTLTPTLALALTLTLTLLLTLTLTDRWRAYYPLTMLSSIAWLGVLVFLMISWAEKAGCMLGISETLTGLTVTAIGTSGPDAIASLIVAKEGNGVTNPT